MVGVKGVQGVGWGGGGGGTWQHWGVGWRLWGRGAEAESVNLGRSPSPKSGESMPIPQTSGPNSGNFAARCIDIGTSRGEMVRIPSSSGFDYTLDCAEAI